MMLIGTLAFAAFSLNLLADVHDMLSYDFMRYAFMAGTAMAVLGGMTGYFVVLRRLPFAGEALSHVAFAAVLGATVVGLDPLVGLFAITAAVAMSMGALGNRARMHDTSVGIVLAWVLGLGALFLSIHTARGGGSNAQIGINALFGSILGVQLPQAQAAVVVAACTLLVLLGIARPLLFASIDPEVAAAQGVPVGALGILFLVLVAVTVAEAVQVVGALLILALLVTPAAVAQRLTPRPFRALLLSALLAVAFTWIGLTLGYYTPYPVSFFITALAFGTYLLTFAAERAWRRWEQRIDTRAGTSKA
ncbi:MAG: metal ABC transporter permease [Chloroflexota bacterium]